MAVEKDSYERILCDSINLLVKGLFGEKNPPRWLVVLWDPDSYKSDVFTNGESMDEAKAVMHRLLAENKEAEYLE